MEFTEREQAYLSLERNHNKLKDHAINFLDKVASNGQHYTWDWFGLPIIQIPHDIMQIQEIIFKTRPTLIVETGIARGGSLAFSASMLALLDVIEKVDPFSSKRKVIGIDIDIRPHNREALANHALYPKMHLIEGSSIDKSVISEVHEIATKHDSVLVILDSNHTHQHVLDELDAYSPLVNLGGYCIVSDTVIDDLPPNSYPNRPWDIDNNPKTAVSAWINSHPEFQIDSKIDQKLLLSSSPSGYLLKIN